MKRLNLNKDNIFNVRNEIMLSNICKLLILIVLAICLAACEKAPLCLEESDYKSYYQPGGRTRNVAKGVPCSKPKLMGQSLPKPMIIMSDIGGAVTRIDTNGELDWQYSVKGGARLKDLRLVNDHARFIIGNTLMGINLESGRNWSVSALSGDFYAFTSYMATNDNCAIVLSTNDCIPAQYARAVERIGNTIFVADTFGHRIIAYDMLTKQTLFTEPVYFPNDLQVLDNNTLLVTEEHANRVFKLDLTTFNRTLVYGCQLDIYGDIYSTPDEIKAREQSGALTKANGRGICEEILYSPNGAVQMDGYTIISDTDNHRVLLIDSNGIIVSQVENFNNPVRAYFVD